MIDNMTKQLAEWRTKMYIIVGLGNPESKYNGTRHNIGFSAITALADANNISLDMKKHKALCGKGVIAGQKVLLAEPLTNMNLSGESVRELVDYYKVDPTDELIIIYDDINLAPGKLLSHTDADPRKFLTSQMCNDILDPIVTACTSFFSDTKLSRSQIDIIVGLGNPESK